jgi:hypothetical protein
LILPSPNLSDSHRHHFDCCNETGNDEVMFRASNNDGSIFADKANLSNTTSTDSQDPEIFADGDTVVVTWWERNATSELPAA